MGAYAVDYIDKAVNNSNYAGSTVKNIASNNASYVGNSLASATVATAKTAEGLTVGSALRFGAKSVFRLNPYIGAASLLYDAYKFFTDDEIAQLPEAEQQIAKEAQQYSKVVEAQQQKVDEIKQEIKSVSESVEYQQGQTLPSVLSQNAKALTLSVNALTVTLSEQLSLMNNYMMANLIYQQQFLDIKASESGLNVESLEYNKTTQSVKDLDGNMVASFSPREAELAKNATVAREVTDKNNFTLDDDIDLEDIVDGVEISSIFGYSGDTEPLKEFYTRLGGQGL